MWLTLIGPPTCKQVAADLLVKERGYKIIGEQLSHDPNFYSQLETLNQRFKDNIASQEAMTKAEVINLFSFWDTHEVFDKALHEMEELSDYEFDLMESTYLNYCPFVEPPHAFIYCKAPPIWIQNRMSFKNETPNENLIKRVSKHYEDFVERVRIPIIDVDATLPFDQIWELLSYDVDQIKTAAMATQTMWTRSVFRNGRLP